MKRKFPLFAVTFCLIQVHDISRGDQAATSPSTTSIQTLKTVDLDAGAGDGLTLKGGIQVKMVRKGGLISMTVKSSTVTHSDDFVRDVVVYVSQPIPTFTIVADRFASDEDRLIVYDMGDKVKPLKIAHDSTDSYSHQHFAVMSIQDDGVMIVETEYAGDNAPRQRELFIGKSENGFSIKPGAWKNQ